MTRDVCMNALAVIDGKAIATNELIQMVRTVGAEAFHKAWSESMKNAGWRCGGAETNHATLMTPHLRRWSLLVDAQRNPLFEVALQEVKATWEDGDDE